MYSKGSAPPSTLRSDHGSPMPSTGHGTRSGSKSSRPLGPLGNENVGLDEATDAFHEPTGSLRRSASSAMAAS